MAENIDQGSSDPPHVVILVSEANQKEAEERGETRLEIVPLEKFKAGEIPNQMKFQYAITIAVTKTVHSELTATLRPITVDGLPIDNKPSAPIKQDLDSQTYFSSEEIPAEEIPPTEEPAEEAPATEEPTEEAPAAEEPTEEAPAAEEPTEEAPAAEELTEEAQTEEQPAQEVETPEEAPTGEESAEGTPAEEELTEQTPAEEEPTEEGPVEEIANNEESTEETPTGEEPAEEGPVEETQVTEDLSEETPTGEEPAGEETADEGKPTEEMPAEEQPAEETPDVDEQVDETQAEEELAEETPTGEEQTEEPTMATSGEESDEVKPTEEPETEEEQTEEVPISEKMSERVVTFEEQQENVKTETVETKRAPQDLESCPSLCARGGGISIMRSLEKTDKEIKLTIGEGYGQLDVTVKAADTGNALSFEINFPECPHLQSAGVLEATSQPPDEQLSAPDQIPETDDLYTTEGKGPVPGTDIEQEISTESDTAPEIESSPEEITPVSVEVETQQEQDEGALEIEEISSEVEELPTEMGEFPQEEETEEPKPETEETVADIEETVPGTEETEPETEETAPETEETAPETEETVPETEETVPETEETVPETEETVPETEETVPETEETSPESEIVTLPEEGQTELEETLPETIESLPEPESDIAGGEEQPEMAEIPTEIETEPYPEDMPPKSETRVTFSEEIMPSGLDVETTPKDTEVKSKEPSEASKMIQEGKSMEMKQTCGVPCVKDTAPSMEHCDGEIKFTITGQGCGQLEMKLKTFGTRQELVLDINPPDYSHPYPSCRYTTASPELAKTQAETLPKEPSIHESEVEISQNLSPDTDAMLEEENEIEEGAFEPESETVPETSLEMEETQPEVEIENVEYPETNETQQEDEIELIPHAESEETEEEEPQIGELPNEEIPDQEEIVLDTEAKVAEDFPEIEETQQEPEAEGELQEELLEPNIDIPIEEVEIVETVATEEIQQEPEPETTFDKEPSETEEPQPELNTEETLETPEAVEEPAIEVPEQEPQSELNTEETLETPEAVEEPGIEVLEQESFPESGGILPYVKCDDEVMPEEPSPTTESDGAELQDIGGPLDIESTQEIQLGDVNIAIEAKESEKGPQLKCTVSKASKGATDLDICPKTCPSQLEKSQIPDDGNNIVLSVGNKFKMIVKSGYSDSKEIHLDFFM